MLCKQSKSKTSIDAARLFFESQDDGPQEISTSPASITFFEARKLIGAAFGGKTIETADKIMSSMVLKPLDLGSPEQAKDRQELAAFCLGFFTHELIAKGGMAVGIRKSGQLKAAVVFREYEISKDAQEPNIFGRISAIIGFIKAYLAMRKDPLGLPAILSDKSKQKKLKESLNKVQPMENNLRKWHAEHGPKGPHWYVGLVASDPETQGQGHCKEALNLLSRAADECQMTCYLECNDRLRKYYEKFGFQATKAVTTELDGMKSSGFLMTRPHA